MLVPWQTDIPLTLSYQVWHSITAQSLENTNLLHYPIAILNLTTYILQRHTYSRRLEMLEEELRRCTAEAKAAREELTAARKLWEAALKAKESEVTMLRENLDLMRENSSGKETAAMAAAKAELNEVRAQLKMMQDRYTEVQEELERRRKIAEERLQNVSDDVNLLRRKLSLVYEAVKEPPKVEVITMAPEHKDMKNIGVGVE
ncbi:hypothetical protein PHET_01716 [Paragonimus heterotremus]|uniref:Uncharacterized protein n=1 Tax=Paragonimus heterotremus TaxID=100268 RepID=A0A8J4TQX6_9TREM|nr:hypothetical protein PHET_01716 [Paragonimus heterotremus]